MKCLFNVHIWQALIYLFWLCVSDGREDIILAPTQLGSAVVASALSPDEGLAVFAELQKARRCFVLENELHTVYLVSGKFVLNQLNRMQ